MPTKIRHRIAMTASCLLLASILTPSAKSQEGPADERSAMAPASEAPGLSKTQQARMKLLSGQRQQEQAEKYEAKATEAKSESKKAKLREKAKKAFEGAIRDYFATLQLKPDQPEAFVGLGQLYAKAGQMENSLKHFDQALQLDANNADALIGKARGQLASFHVEEAKASYGTLKSVDGETAGVFLAEMRVWLEAKKVQLGPEMAEAIAELEAWISENESS